MTARGAKAEGQNVYLFKKMDDSFEYVQKEGGVGGGSVRSHTWGKNILTPRIKRCRWSLS